MTFERKNEFRNVISDFPNGMKNDIISSSVLKLDHEFFYMIGVSEYFAKFRSLCFLSFLLTYATFL